jgi:pimeloyl-ACP methyl ester carboxylesterase
MRKLSFFFIQLFLLINTANAQVHTPRFISINSNTNGFYEYLPQGYGSGTQTYPLILFIHGSTELGNTGAALSTVLTSGIPHEIEVDSFPESVTVNGQVHRFIVISPQFHNWPTPTDISQVLDYVVANYRVNLNRIYLTGLSMGGGATWEFAGASAANAARLAAIVPVAGASWPEQTRAYTIGDADLPVWATHNNGDPQVDVWYTNYYVDQINSRNPTPLAIRSIFNSNLHDAWSTTYDPFYRENGLNVYEWMLQYQRNIVPLPVNIINYKAVKSGQRSVISWTTTYEANNRHFTVERSSNGIDFQIIATIAGANTGRDYVAYDDRPLPGDNFYRLSQTDLDGRITYFEILKVSMTAVKGGMILSPNPAQGNVNIKLTRTETGMMQAGIIDLNGRMIRSWMINKTANEFTQPLDVSALPSGTYFIQVKGDGFVETTKLVRN